MKAVLFFIFVAISVTLLSQESRIALVIGNGNYANGPIQPHPVADAHLLSFSFEDVGFEVISITDANKEEMEEAIAKFMEGAASADVLAFFYAGFGVHTKDINYLVPVDAKLKRAKDLEKEAVNANKIVEQMGLLEGSLKMVILDGCGVPPENPWFAKAEQGFTAMEVPDKSIVSFSSAPGKTAFEAGGPSGLYVDNFTKQLLIPQAIWQVFDNTALLVKHASKGSQAPEEWSEYGGSLSLLPGADLAPETTGSIMITSRIAGKLYLEDIELASVEPNSVVPLDNLKSGVYKLKIAGNEVWEEEVLVLANQQSNVSAIVQKKQATAAIVATSVATAASLTPGELFVDSRDSNEYTWVQIGSQTWMSQNLAFEVQGGSYCYDKDESNCESFGRLYTWKAAREACPDGWHLPSDMEWRTLEMSLGLKEGATKKFGLRGKTEGNTLKDNKSFNAVFSGLMTTDEESVEMGETAVFWTATDYKTESAVYRKVEDSKGGIHKFYSDQSRRYSVRCVKD